MLIKIRAIDQVNNYKPAQQTETVFWKSRCSYQYSKNPSVDGGILVLHVYLPLSIPKITIQYHRYTVMTHMHPVKGAFCLQAKRLFFTDFSSLHYNFTVLDEQADWLRSCLCTCGFTTSIPSNYFVQYLTTEKCIYIDICNHKYTSW